MKRLIYKSNLKPDKMPAWLTCILHITLEPWFCRTLKGDVAEFLTIKQEIDDDIERMKKVSGRMKVFPEAVLVTAGEETALFIKRSGRILVTIYIKEVKLCIK